MVVPYIIVYITQIIKVWTGVQFVPIRVAGRARVAAGLSVPPRDWYRTRVHIAEGSHAGSSYSMKAKIPRELRNVPWITADGSLDFTKYPIDSILRQCLDSDSGEFGSGCRLLETMVAHGRVEAGIFLLGLLRYYEDELSVLGVVVESLRAFKDARCAAALFGELRRVPSSNKTRTYLNAVIGTLSRLPADMVLERFWELAEDSASSYRMRAKFKAAAEAVEGRW